MSHQPLFSTYRAGENRVTSSMLAVFQRIDLGLVARLLAAAAGESSLDMVTYTNQVASAGAKSVPDAAISANFRFLFEVKIVRNAVTSKQIAGHLHLLDKTHADERLFVITPDVVPPKGLPPQDSRVTWLNFLALHQAIDDLLADPTELLGDRATFLLRELQALFRADGLLQQADVVVVAARHAYPEYPTISAYVCQANRSFAAGLTHVGFYADGAIQPTIPRILYREDNITFSYPEADQREATDDARQKQIAAIIRTCLDNGSRVESQPYQVFLLSRPADHDTVHLAAPIANTTTTATGKPWAWTLGQRYVRLKSLLTNPASTSELDAHEAQASNI